MMHWRASIRLMLLLLFVTAMAGCLTAAQRQVLAITQAGKAANERTLACLKGITDNPAYEPLAKRAPLDSRINPSLLQLADSTYVTDDEIQLIIAAHNDIAACRAQAIESMMPILPGIIPIFVQGYHEADLITVDLIERKITWGENNKQRVRLKDETMEKGRVALMQLARDLEASHNAEVLQRQIAFAALSDWAIKQQALIQNQRLINTLTKPVVTSCSGTGVYFRCVTR